MIASFSHNFIFLKTSKTGGTSAEIAMSAVCSGRDICTPISPEDELIRAEHGGSALNFVDDQQLIHSFQEAARQRDKKTLKSLKKDAEATGPFYNHMNAIQVRELLPELWAVADKFTIERHPYERAVSGAWWKTRGNLKNLDEAVRNFIATPRFRSQNIYMDRDKILVDRIIEYRSLAEEMKAFLAPKGYSSELPTAKSKYRKSRRPAHEVLSASLKDQIYEATAPVFECMGYER